MVASRRPSACQIASQAADHVSPLASHFLDDLLEHQGVIVPVVAGTVDQGDGARGGPRSHLSQYLPLARFPQLLAVPVSEFGPVGRILAEPAAKVIALLEQGLVERQARQDAVEVEA